jgi:hypothetical protein
MVGESILKKGLGKRENFKNEEKSCFGAGVDIFW